MSDWIYIDKDLKHIAREREKAKKLRDTLWWQNRIAAGVCHYCQKHFLPDELTMDHVVPLSRGGRSNRGNIVPACKTCNNEKKYLTPVEMLLQKLQHDESIPEE